MSLGVILRPHRGPEAFEKALEEVLDAVLLKTWFLKDVLNEITTFRGSLDPENCPETTYNA